MWTPIDKSSPAFGRFLLIVVNCFVSRCESRSIWSTRWYVWPTWSNGIALMRCASVTSRLSAAAELLRRVWFIRWECGVGVGRESILASIHRRDVFANQSAHWSFEPSALASAFGRSRHPGIAGGGHFCRAALRHDTQEQPETVIVDTTVMPETIAYPTDSRLLERSRERLVKIASECGLKLRQNYNREAPRLVLQIGCYWQRTINLKHRDK